MPTPKIKSDILKVSDWGVLKIKTSQKDGGWQGGSEEEGVNE